MADLDDADESAPEQRRGGILHAVALACAVALAIGGIGAAAWRAGVGRIASQPAVVPPAVAGTREGTLEPMDPFIANLADEDGKRYLKATFQVEFFGSRVPDEFTARVPQMRDLVLTLLTSKLFAEVRTPEGKAVLRDEIINRMNRVVNRDLVKAVYFTEFIVQ